MVKNLLFSFEGSALSYFYEIVGPGIYKLSFTEEYGRSVASNPIYDIHTLKLLAVHSLKLVYERGLEPLCTTEMVGFLKDCGINFDIVGEVVVG
jgi:hypothetical protein